MGFGSLQRRLYQEAEITFMQQVASQVAVAVDNVLHAASAQSAQHQLKHERDRASLLLEINNAVVSHLDLRELLRVVSACRGILSLRFRDSGVARPCAELSK
jgi:formate hydrogenlyase transcriptional activator